MAKILKHGKNYIEEAQKAYKDVIVQCPECDNTICTSYYYLEVETNVPCECQCGCSFIPEKSDIVTKTGQREGKWIRPRPFLPCHCSECLATYTERGELPDYCPECGKEMR